MRIRRDNSEEVPLGGLSRDLPAPESVEQITADMQAYFLERSRTEDARAVEVPRELHELTARITRLRDRLRAGDPDRSADEIQAAIERAE